MKKMDTIAVIEPTNSLSRRLTALFTGLFILLLITSYRNTSVLADETTPQAEPGTPQLPLVPGDENWDNRPGLPGLSGDVYAIAVSGSNVYVGGSFTTVGGISANNIARWDGNQWYTLGGGPQNGVSGPVLAITVAGSDLYVGGAFGMAGGAPANNIARWNGSTWFPLANGANIGTNNSVATVAVSGSNVYAGGDFTTAGGVSASHVARWDGSKWFALGSGVTTGATVKAIAVSGSNVYVGGTFVTAGGITANHIAQWDGSQWRSVGSGTNNGVDDTVLAIVTNGTSVFVAGRFSKAGVVTASRIARWDGIQWNAIGSGVGGATFTWINAIATSGSNVYVGGSFTTAGGVSSNNIARWDGTQWYSLGSGANNEVFAITANAFDVYTGGAFTVAGNKPSLHLGVWHEPCPMNFTDVPTSNIYYQPIRYLYCRNIVSGYGNSFLPANTTTRGQLSKIIVLARGWTQVCPSIAHFTDVPSSNVFYCFVETAYARSLISGYTCGGPGEPCDSGNRPYFRSNDEVSRGQLSKIIVTAMGWMQVCPSTGHFTDVLANNVFYCSIETALVHSIISGYGDNTFHPGDSATRGQISKIVYQAVTNP